jgi:microcystin-dependent protein
MADLIVTGVSDYLTGGIDSATVLVSNVSPISARHPNGLASAAVQIETILGSGTSLKGSTADLVARLSVALNSTGTVRLDGFTGLTTDRGLLALSSTQLQVMNHTPIGVVEAFAGSVQPANWLMCDGQAVSRSTYTKLFAITSTTYGVGNGSTTFNVPDLRGRTVVMVDGSANRITSASTNGANADTLGGAGGAETHTLTNAEAPPLPHTHTTASAFAATGGGPSVPPATSTFTVTASNWTIGSSSPGGGGAHSNTQPWLALNYIIFAGV